MTLRIFFVVLTLVLFSATQSMSAEKGKMKRAPAAGASRCDQDPCEADCPCSDSCSYPEGSTCYKPPRGGCKKLCNKGDSCTQDKPGDSVCGIACLCDKKK